MVANGQELAGSLDILDIGVAIFDDCHKLIEINSVWSRLFGSGEAPAGTSYVEMLLGLGESDQVSADRVNWWLSGYSGVMNGARRRTEWQLETGRWVEILERQLDQGGLVLQAIDISRQKERIHFLETRSEPEASMLGTVTVGDTGIVIADATREGYPIIHVNDAFCEMTGYTPNDCLGRGLEFLQGAETDEKAIQALHAACDLGEPINIEIVTHRKSGEPFWNALDMTPVRNEMGTVTSFVATFDDLTVSEAIAEEIVETTVLDLDRDTALAELAYEMRSPLSAIAGFAEAMSAERFGPVGTPEYKDFADAMSASADRLLGAVDGLIDLVGAEETNALEIERFDVQGFLDELSTALNVWPDAGGRQITVAKCDQLDAITADRGRLSAAIFDLLAHALERTSEEEAIALEVRRDENGGVLFELTRPSGPDPRRTQMAWTSEDELPALARLYAGLHGGEIRVPIDSEALVVLALPAEQADGVEHANDSAPIRIHTKVEPPLMPDNEDAHYAL